MKIDCKTLISIILPCYNEEAILLDNFKIINDFLESRRSKYSWEVLIIDDGSKDRTGAIAEEIVKNYSSTKVFHHPTNLNLGKALQTGFKNSKGEVIVVLDVDLSYSVENIEILTDKLLSDAADIVIASPYMKGGKVTAVPFLRKLMSRWVNGFMRFASQERYYTFTSMVRAYRGSFIRSLNLKTKDYEVNPEILYKGMILRARIIEVPAHLDWTEQNKVAGKRTSSMRIIRGTFSGLMSAFIFRPYIFFIGVGLILMCLSMYQILWLLYDTTIYWHSILNNATHIEYPFSYSLATQFNKNPQSFLVGGITLLASIQFLGLGFISLQNKRYFEELFHITSCIKTSLAKNDYVDKDL
jgi:glycosyltransferase involved in cell wall biosynthesis